MLGIIGVKDINVMRVNLWIFLGCISLLSFVGLFQKNDTVIASYCVILLIICLFIIILTLIKCEIEIKERSQNELDVERLADFENL